ncbi:MAG: gamma-glutamyltransferase [Alphaproteobacteria bacterium]|nr:gamma-glutamyltransferase [Alphaproteobacteria bacterium]
MRSFHLPGRSTIHGVNGAAATSHPAATLAAIDLLRAGGNAVDAAVAAAAVQAVVEPGSTGVGGDVFCLYCKGGRGEVIGYNGSGRAPAGLTPETFRAAGLKEVPLTSPHAVTVPGAIEAWDRLVREHGRKNLAEVLAPAIGYAENGYVISPRVAHDWAGSLAKLSAHAGSKRIYLPKGRAPTVGEVHRLPELAQTLKSIARDGAKAFYDGPVAADIVSTLRELGGTHQLSDLASHRGEYVTPITTDYRGHTCFQIPPNGHGITALILLNLLEGFEMSSYAPLSADRLHIYAEATKLAYGLRNRYVADPAHAAVPVAELLDKKQAARWRARIALDKATQPGWSEDAAIHKDTVYLTVVDRDRNVCSFINSLFHGFGSGITAPRSGVVLQNRGCGFTLKDGHPNQVAPGKRPLHTIIPGMVQKDGKVFATYGVMGGQFQPIGHAWVLGNVIDQGCDPQEAIDMPRAFFEQGAYGLEEGIPQAAAEELARRGHPVKRVSGPFGGGQMIMLDWTNGTLVAGSDPRKDGCAIAY